MSALPCIRCGECSAVCPAGIHPHLVLAALRGDDLTSARERGLDRCSGCGQCDAYCPSRIPLSDIFATQLDAIRLDEHRRAFALAARERYRSRETRLQREREEHAAERERQRTANASAQAVAAALARARARRRDGDNPPS
ncbi:4Fe-4S dicluster domain-containing protein [Xanthomonadaceae bacterium JHOS43]|nr:4Fe-4S dicluster domain-containing protein [Xanthomonadaceae bacterium JHOS43]